MHFKGSYDYHRGGALDTDRSCSTVSVMQPLSFDRVDEVAHPLSSMRSCSEYGISDLSVSAHKRGAQRRPSLWVRIVRWAAGNTTHRMNLEETSGHQDVQLKYVPSRKYGHYYSERHIKLPSTASSIKLKRKKRSPETSVSSEITSALDFVFGLSSKSKVPLKEVELNNLINPSVIAQLSAHMEPTTVMFSDLPFRRTVSLRSFQQICGGDSRLDSNPSDETDSVHNVTHVSNASSLTCWRERITIRIGHFLSDMRTRGQLEDNELFYTLQGQPFSSGIYLRGMLSAGMNGALFHTYSLIFLPPLFLFKEVTLSVFLFQYVVVGLLVLQVMLNMIATPVRILLHYKCWKACRSLDADTASQALQSMVQSDAWMLNHLLASTLDVMALVVLVICQGYMWASSPVIVKDITTTTSDPLLSLLLGMCATNLVSFILRAVVAVVYFLSFLDGTARIRGGLSKFDLDRYPTFVYTNKEEVFNDECSICLTEFHMGEMLISLPCHKHHSFHANCIRKWLQRQNLCPLCQKRC
mmetsp:Transcript_9999/g.15104  ORF Transcript_9999/g.15104 Transcript_9999/m.15104 type:complete len:526 (-) Transcript_9999:235-1812(-)|eukprot:CAMPEP_0185040088 /NCGR_PEP_ID=MMETSP1103-20130426/37722_1 /TAXON_ID=36769 /ORGANISM="Paraphysomonas bandaiensis, Strain Caron Lab Isolate" /LENGTH=525 /DNA_ID=CAMNT_0027579243 /DNA_START=116 /DNA_END=1693 /DNA_ORIENTATION=-